MVTEFPWALTTGHRSWHTYCSWLGPFTLLLLPPPPPLHPTRLMCFFSKATKPLNSPGELKSPFLNTSLQAIMVDSPLFTTLIFKPTSSRTHTCSYCQKPFQVGPSILETWCGVCVYIYIHELSNCPMQKRPQSKCYPSPRPCHICGCGMFSSRPGPVNIVTGYIQPHTLTTGLRLTVSSPGLR